MSDVESLRLLIEAVEEHANENPEHDPVDMRLYGVLGSINSQVTLPAVTSAARIVFAVPGKFMGCHAPESSPISESM